MHADQAELSRPRVPSLEGIITNMSDVASMRICEEESLADIKLSKPGFKPPPRRTLASGCGGGVTFATEKRKVQSGMVVKGDEVLSLMKQLNERAELYKYCGGVHTSALGDNSTLLVVAEDIEAQHARQDNGRMSAQEIIDQGQGVNHHRTHSSEMLGKAASMMTPS